MKHDEIKSEIEKAIQIARKYGVGKLYLIGSTLGENPEEAGDYDFAVMDVPRGSFFKFYGELMKNLSKNVDLINLSGRKTLFKKLVMSEGRLVYEKGAS